MAAHLEDPAEEIKRLRHCINDLVGILALPAMWAGADSTQIVRTLLGALLSMLGLDFVYAQWRDPAGAEPIEIARVAESWQSARPQDIGLMLFQQLGDDPQKWAPLMRSPFGGGDISVVPLRLGMHGEIGLIAAGSGRTGFPEQAEKLVLNVAANQASTGLQEARLLSEQKRVASELDSRVAQRTAELAAINEELREEIGERKKVEERLLDSESALEKALEEIKKSEAKLRQVIDTIPTLAWCNLPDGPNEFLNKGWHEYTGLSEEESNGWGWQAAFHPEDLPPLMKRWQELLVSGERGEIEARLRRHDGAYRWFLIRVEPFRDEAGKIVRWYGTSADIEDRKRAEEELRRSEAFLAQAQRLSLTGSFLWRVETDEITWSDQVYRIFEFDTGVPITLERIGSRVHPDDIPMLNDMIDRARNRGDDFEYEHRLQMPDQAVKHLHMVGHGTRDKDGRLVYIGAVQDVTEHRLSEQALARVRSELSHVARITSLGALTASIAHEVNQPLSGIITNASTCLRMLAADPPNVDGARETALRTIRDGNRASDVVTRLRALFSKKEATRELVDLNEATQEVIALSLSELQGNRAVVRAEFADELPLLMGDRIQIQQVILNLVRNAADAMSVVDDRPRQLLIRTEREDGDRVRLSVQDTGIGLDPRAADRLFEAFYTTKDEGMGMGLSISRSIIESHQGRLWAIPNEGPGATFLFSIPCSTNT